MRELICGDDTAWIHVASLRAAYDTLWAEASTARRLRVDGGFEYFDGHTCREKSPTDCPEVALERV